VYHVKLFRQEEVDLVKDLLKIKHTRDPKKAGRSRSRRGSSQSRSPGSPDPLAKYREYVAFIQKDMEIKGGPLTNSFAAYFRELAKKENPNASQDELNNKAKVIYAENKKLGKIKDIFNKVKDNLERKRANKKEQKAAQKQASRRDLLSTASSMSN
jgi:hypothetical protein